MKKEFKEGNITITVDYDKCKGSGECITACPVEIFELVNGKATAKTLQNASNAALVSTLVPILRLNTVPANLLNSSRTYMQKKQTEVYLVNSWPEDEIVLLYKDAGWWKDTYDKSGISQLITGSFAFAIAIDKKPETQ